MESRWKYFLMERKLLYIPQIINREILVWYLHYYLCPFLGALNTKPGSRNVLLTQKTALVTQNEFGANIFLPL